MSIAATAGATILLVMILAGQAQAQAPGSSFVDVRCGAVEGSEIERLLAVELAQEQPPNDQALVLRVVVACGPRATQIQVVTGPERARRIIPSPALDEPGAPRVLAVAASQLIIALWYDLPLPPDELEPEPEPVELHPDGPPDPQPPQGDPDEDPAPLVEEPTGQQRRCCAATLGIRGMALLRDMGEPFVAGSGALFSRIILSELLAVVVEAGGSYGETDRALGQVVSASAWLGAGGALLWHIAPIFDLQAALTAQVAWQRLRGKPGTESHVGLTRQGFVPQLALSVEGIIWAGRAGIGLFVRGGWTLVSLEGEIEDQRPVNIGGLHLAFGLSVEVSL